MYSLTFVLFACFSLYYTDGSYVDSLAKCSIKDQKCMTDLLQKVFHDIGERGIPEINLIPVDPLQITNFSVPVMDGLVVTVKDGVIKGLKNCIIASFNIDLVKELATTEITCDVLVIKGQFAIESSNPMILPLLAAKDRVNADGKIKMKIDKMTVSLELPVAVIKKEDGETHFDVMTDKSKYTYNLQNMKVEVKNLVIGENDISPLVNQYMNDNWKSMVKLYGKAFLDKSMKLTYSFIHTFYENVSSKKLIIEDLTSYVKN